MNLDFLPTGPITSLPDALWHLHLSRRWLFAGGIMLAVFALWLLFHPRKRRAHVARLGGLTWRRNQFCRGWLITGDTGSGKTSSGINQLAHQVFQNEPRWGGLCIDEKGVYWETLSAMARHYGREHDLIHLQIRDVDADPAPPPAHRYNLTGDRSIPFTTYAKFIVDTATSLGQGGDKGFFKSQAQTHIAHALELLYELKRPVTLQGAFGMLSDTALLEEELQNLADLLETPRRVAVHAHFTNRLLHQPEEQLGGVRETIGNYLQYFLTPAVAEVFCAEDSTFNFGSIDHGKIILVTMPQKFQTERRYVNTFLKLLYYNHALRRFDKVKSERAADNLLILWADEAQRFMTASEDGTSDYNCVDVIREHVMQFLRACEDRRTTLLRVATVLAHRQQAYLKSGKMSDLHCFSPEEAGAELQLEGFGGQALSESTVSRAVQDKRVHLPNGDVKPLKLLCSPGEKATTTDGQEVRYLPEIVKKWVLDYIRHEDRLNPLSDDSIARLIARDEDLVLSRKTIENYRKELDIPSARERKRGPAKRSGTSVAP
jgi:hypothetical protein